MPSRDDSRTAQPEWVEHAIWWHVYPLRFAGAPSSAADGPGRGDGLRRITEWLDYAVELGISGILLGPIFDSETHGYDTVDYTRIDPRLGDDDDFASFVAAAKQRGLRILLDGVFNHVGRGFDRFQRALENGSDSPDAAWFRVAGIVDDGTPVFENFEGHEALVVLNHDEPAVADFVADVMTRWLDRGIDGWRLDVAYAVPTAFWATVLGRVRQRHPESWFVGEVIHGGYTDIVAESTLDSVTQYELWKAIHNSIAERNFFELAHALDRHDGFLNLFAPLTFVGNHDVTRIASKIEEDGFGDLRHLVHALVVLFTVGGVPAIYYGDEQGFRGIKEERIGGDDEIRPEFPAAGREALAAEGWLIFHLHQQLIGVRRRHPWLHRARSTTLQLTNTEFVYELRSDTERLVVALSIGDEPILLGQHVGGKLEVVAGELVDGAVAPHGWVIVADAAGRPARR